MCGGLDEGSWGRVGVQLGVWEAHRRGKQVQPLCLCPRESTLPSPVHRDRGLPAEQRVQQRCDLPPEVPLRIQCG